VGGADSLCNLTIEGFMALESLSAEPANSMSRNRKGFNVGEGASLFLMERSTEPAIQLMGVGESSDAYHMSAPSPDGKGALSSMRMALQDAGLSAGDIDYINLHGTGTLLNDSMEALSVSCLFPGVPASTTKGSTGHTLGAAGAMEVGICWLSLQSEDASGNIHLPPHCWDGHGDSDFPKLTIVEPGMILSRKDPGQNHPTNSKSRFILSNSFGFGGSNCSIIIGSHVDDR
jgi:3-oxoacyl-[acyl-carrier-protein] synthase-1